MAKKIAIVLSEFNFEITSSMLEEAKKITTDDGAQIVKIVQVPGAYDMPLAAKKLAGRKDVDAVVALGAIIKGGTKHDEVIAIACTKSLCEISLEFEKPVALGVIGPGATYAQAQERAKDYAKRAVRSALVMIEALKEAKE